MGSDNKLVMPTIMILVMVVLLSVAGWLAYVFFDTMGDRPVQREPFFAVVTSGVQHARQPSPQTTDEVILTPTDTNADTSPAIPPIPAQIMSDQPTSPAVCLDYDQAITKRKAWNNPLEYQATVSPNRVRIAVIMPTTAEGANAP